RRDDVVPRGRVDCLGSMPHLVRGRRVETLRRRSGCLQGHSANWKLRSARVTVELRSRWNCRAGDRMKPYEAAHATSEVMMMAEGQGNGHDSPEHDSTWQPSPPPGTDPGDGTPEPDSASSGPAQPGPGQPGSGQPGPGQPGPGQPGPGIPGQEAQPLGGLSSPWQAQPGTQPAWTPPQPWTAPSGHAGQGTQPTAGTQPTPGAQPAPGIQSYGTPPQPPYGAAQPTQPIYGPPPGYGAQFGTPGYSGQPPYTAQPGG